MCTKLERLEKSHKGWETAVSIAAENYEEACGNPIVFTATECVERYAEMAEAKYQECATKIALLKEKLRVETLDKLEREAIKEELEEAEKRLDNLKKRAEAARGKATQPKADEAEGKADKPEADKAEGKADKPEADKAEGKADKPEADKAEGKPNWTRILLFIAVILITAMLLRQCAPQLKSLWQQSQTRQQLQYEQQIQEMQLLQQLKQQRIDPVVQEQQPTTRRGEANEGNFVKSVSIQDWYDTNIYDPVIWMTGVDPSAYIGQAPDPMLDALGINQREPGVKPKGFNVAESSGICPVGYNCTISYGRTVIACGSSVDCMFEKGDYVHIYLPVGEKFNGLPGVQSVTQAPAPQQQPLGGGSNATEPEEKLPLRACSIKSVGSSFSGRMSGVGDALSTRVVFFNSTYEELKNAFPQIGNFWAQSGTCDVSSMANQSRNADWKSWSGTYAAFGDGLSFDGKQFSFK